MQVLVDTCVWSHALRRTQDNHHAQELSEIISDNRATIIGPIRQEVLSGIREKKQFLILRDHLSAFPDLLIKTVDYESAIDILTHLHYR